MPVIFGKPGTRRFGGTLLGQMKDAKKDIDAIVKYHDKMAAKTPPVVVLTTQQRADLVAASGDLAVLIPAVN